jgi:hypothetical protein
LEAYCKLNRLVPEKPKRILAQIQANDPELRALVMAYLTENAENVPLVTQIVDHVLAPVVVS